MSGSDERYAFGPFILDASERRLTRKGLPLPLREKVFETLLLLVRNAGRLMPKEEILDAIWPETHVEEANLNQNVSEIRRALGDGLFIQTVPKRGFRFVAPVRRVTEAPSRALRQRASQLAVLATLVVAAVALPIGSDHARSDRPPLRSIAVVPFRLLGASTDRAYVAASLGETLTNRLSAIPSLVVRPGTSSDADAILTGAVQPNGDSLRITAELVDTRRKVTLWSRSYDCATADLLAIEDALASDLGKRLRPGLTREERARLTPPHSADAAANEQYLRGRDLLDRRVSLDESILHFEKALARDPSFALAWAGLAEALVQPTPRVAPQVIERASAAARRSIALEPALAEGHAVLGFIRLFYDWNWDGAERELRFALLVNPGSPRIHDWYAIALLTRGRPAEAVREIQRAHEIDPESADIAGDVALVEYEARDYRSAENAARAALLLDPLGAARSYLIDSLTMEHRSEEALAEIAAMNRPEPLAQLTADVLRSPADAAKEIHRAEPELASLSPDGVAALYAAAGDKEKAMEWLERAYRQRAFGLIFLGVAPEFDPLRSDAQFRDLVRRVGVLESAPKS